MRASQECYQAVTVRACRLEIFAFYLAELEAIPQVGA